MYVTTEPGLHQTNIIMLSALERKNEKIICVNWCSDMERST